VSFISESFRAARPTPRGRGRPSAGLPLAIAWVLVVGLPVASAAAAAGQTTGGGVLAARGAIAGTVLDADTGAPLADVRVTAVAAKRSTTTDAHGAFVLADLAVGLDTLVVSCVGYRLARPEVTVRAAATVTVTVPLTPGTAAYTDQVTVTGDRFRGADPAVASQEIVTSAEIQDLRGVLTDDPLRAIQALPGVATNDDFRSEFSVRGADFRHMGVSLDGVVTPWLVHSVRNYEDAGSVSIINGDIIDNVTLEAGAYPQIRPGRTGAWLDYDIRDGSRAATEVRGAIGMTSASIVADGPLGNGRRGSWLVSVRDSYVQWLLARLNYSGARFGFSDLQAKLTFEVTPHERVQFTLIGGASELDETIDSAGAQLTGRDETGVAILGWRSTFGPVVLDQHVAAHGDLFNANITGGVILGAEGPVTHSTASEITYDMDASWNVRPSLVARLGVYAARSEAGDATFTFLDAPHGQLQVLPLKDGGRGTTVSGFGRLVWTGTSGTTIDGGLGAERSTLTGELSATPWLLVAQPLSTRWTLRGGVSQSAQVPDLDEVTGTLARPSPQNETATSIDAGLEFRPATTVRVDVNAYNRDEHHVFRLEDSETRLINGRLALSGGMTPFQQNALSASSRGVEIEVERRSEKGLSGWIGYAYGRTRDTDALTGETFWGDFDQRHTVNVYAEDRLTAKTSISAKLRVGSNVPLLGYFQGDPTRTLEIGSDRNTVRLPTYARVDLRANHSFVFTKHRLTLFVEVINVLDRMNLIPSPPAQVLPTGLVRFETTPLFPILPSAGLVIEW
jgi:hypothetical protein